MRWDVLHRRDGGYRDQRDGTPSADGQQLHVAIARPPLLLVCVAKAAACAPAVIEASHFAVNVLQNGQQPESISFSTRAEDRFGTTIWSPGEYGAPVLQESLSVFECEAYAVHDGGDHHILVGQVVKASFEQRLDPLLYFRGSYRRLHFD